ncbi:MAG: hypothetical protein ABSD20_06785 [Terriglobales bacterium]|jgi:hypothetical protein
MRMCNRLLILVVILVSMTIAVRHSEAAEANCNQKLVDGTTVPATTSYIYPSQTVVPFYQWENNNGYCGEVSMMQAGLNHGQWMSQFNARLICGTGLSQSGPDGWCADYKNVPNYNAQVLLESPGTGVTGPNTYADAALCLSNSQLSAKTYPYTSGFKSANTGMSGYEDYMSWVKNEVIAGHQVTVGILWKYGNDPQYDHEVSVIKIGTNHSPTDPTYYADDVLYLDDHGLYDLVGTKLSNDNPAIPYGAGSDDTGCTPYVYGYTFGSLPKTRSKASASGAQGYSIIIPGVNPTNTYAGGNGYNGTTAITGHNYAFSVSGAIDNSAGGPFLLPVQLSIPSATYTDAVANPMDPVAGWQYENSMIGTSLKGTSCTNTPPEYWMYPLTLQATVSGLTTGTAYNLYEYDFSTVAGTGAAAALAVPTANFNANKGMATYTTQFTATGSTYSQTVTRTSDQVVVFRAVPASAP